MFLCTTHTVFFVLSLVFVKNDLLELTEKSRLTDK